MSITPLLKGGDDKHTLTHNFMYSVTHPDHPGVVHYLMGVLENPPEELHEKIAADIIHSDAFAKSSMLVLESFPVAKPLPSVPLREPHHDHHPHRPERVPLKKNISGTLHSMAKEMGKDVEPLHTPTHMSNQKLLRLFDKMAVPHNWAKVALSSIPLGLTSIGYALLKREREGAESAMSCDRYEHDDMTIPFQRAMQSTKSRKYMVQLPNNRALLMGYDGQRHSFFRNNGLQRAACDGRFTEPDVDTKKVPGGMFVALPLLRIVDPEYGLAIQLARAGFEVTPVENWRHSRHPAGTDHCLYAEEVAAEAAAVRNSAM